MAKNIVLAHGILGFGRNFVFPVSYFNGVADHFVRDGHSVLEPQVNPIGTVIERGRKLAAAILTRFPAPSEIHIIAHSMGGLDARYALAHFPDLGKRVKTLVTIGTPHRGSPVADAIIDSTDPLFDHIPSYLTTWLDGLHDLTSERGILFDETTPDMRGVKYIEVAGNAAQGNDGLFLFELARIIGDIKDEINDGVVTRSSALRNVDGHIHLPDWPVDHAGEVGWNRSSLLPTLSPAAHLNRYDQIVSMM